MKITVNSQKYYIEQKGKGTPTWLLLHGFMGSHHDFGQISEQLPGQVLVPDLLGHGQSSRSHHQHDYQMERQAADLASLLEQLQVKQVILVGYSMGGRLALDFALRYPDLVQALVLESSTAGIADKMARQKRIEHDEQQAQQLENESFSRFVDYWESLPLFESQKHLPTNIQQKIREQRLRQDPQVLAASLRGMGTGSMPDLWKQLPQLTCPTTLLTGKLDAKFNKLTSQMKELIPKAQRYVLSGAGHNLHLEKPELYVLQLLQVFARTMQAK